MILVIDIGNTNIVTALYEGDQQISKVRQETALPYDPPREEGIDGVIVSSVVPDKDADIIKACKKGILPAPVFVDHRNCGVKISLDRPAEIGADRLCNTAAMLENYYAEGQALIGVDFGTATSFDVISPEKIFLGGALSPGINLSLKAFALAAAQLPELKIEKTKKVIGANTVDAMQSGIYWGYIGLIEGMVARIEKELGCPAKVIATGGLAPLFEENLSLIDMVDPDLTLKGLLHIYRNLT